MLELLVGEAHQRLERGLVAEPVLAADVEDLGADVALDHAEHVGVGAALHLAEQPLFAVVEDFQLGGFGRRLHPAGVGVGLLVAAALALDLLLLLLLRHGTAPFVRHILPGVSDCPT